MNQIIVPDRYEVLSRKVSKDSISQIVVRVPKAIEDFDRVFGRMRAAGRGAFVVLRGDSGAGKSTFLHTLGVFKKDITTYSVASDASIKNELIKLSKGPGTKIFVLEEREAATSFSDAELETWLHEINSFLRTSAGELSIVVWPCNTDELQGRIVRLAKSIGGNALIPEESGSIPFSGPEKSQFIEVATKTLSLANQGASISDLGLSESRLEEHANNSSLLGDFFSRIHEEIITQEQAVAGLVDKEQCRLWVLVIAGNEPDGDVAALTRGASASVDTERLMSATEANIVADLKLHPEKVGIVGTVLDAKIFHLPVLAANSIVRSFASDPLKARLTLRKFALDQPNEKDATDRLVRTELASVLSGRPTGVRSKKKLGSKSIEAFEKISSIAESNDIELNSTIGQALVKSGLASSYKLEQNFGNGLNRKTDILLETPIGKIRLEVMWRKRTGRADIANYTLTKIYNYARAIGFI